MLSIEYIILLFLIFLYLIKDHSKNLYYIIVGYMILLGMMRGLYVGTDHFGYMDDFYIIKSLNANDYIQHRFEIGYLASILLFKEVSNDYLSFASLSIPPTIIGLIIFIKRHKVNMAYALFIMVTLGIYFSSFNIMRQMLAIGLILPFINLVYEKKYIKFTLITILFSFLFHKSTSFILILIPIHHLSLNIKMINKNLLAILIVFSYIMFFIGKSFLQNNFSIILSAIGYNEFVGYINGINTEGDTKNITASIFTLYSLIWLFVIDKRENIFSYLVFCLYIVFLNLFQMFDVAAGRIALPFLCFFLISIPQTIESKNTKYRIWFSVTTFIFCIGYFINSFCLNNYGEINPFIWRELF